MCTQVRTKELVTLAFRGQDVELKGHVPTFTDRLPLGLGSSFVGHRGSYYFT